MTRLNPPVSAAARRVSPVRLRRGAHSKELQVGSRFFAGWLHEDGQDLVEYALLCAVLAVSCITGILQLSRLREFFDSVGTLLAGVI